MANLTYQRTVIGYHGCDQRVADRVLAGGARLRPSANLYDWLGAGIYFWEHGPRRAYEWAVEQASLSRARIERPAVLGAKINLGVCLDLLDTANTRWLAKQFVQFRRFMRQNGMQLPDNKAAPGTRRADKVLRFLDCAVIDHSIGLAARAQGVDFQTVRGVFVEGGPAFPKSKIILKSHIQIAVRDDACILEFFSPGAQDYS